jgi:hypothetical protein
MKCTFHVIQATSFSDNYIVDKTDTARFTFDAKYGLYSTNTNQVDSGA